MPEVVGLKLDVAKSDIKKSGFDGEVEVLDDGTFGVVMESNWTVCEQSPAAGEEVTVAPRLTVDRSCEEPASSDSTTTPTESTEPQEATTSVPAENYAGPAYEIVIVDKGAGMGVLDQYWVYTDKLDYSTDAYKDQLKLLISDVAREAGTDKLIVEIVTDKEIAEAEAVSTYEAFVAEHGDDYALEVIPEKEKTDWVASYTGGIDRDLAELSDSEAAFGIDWFLASDNPTSEKWKP